MKEQDFNPAISAVVSIRHLVKAIKSNWSGMKSNGNDSEKKLATLSALVFNFGSESTQQKWVIEFGKYTENITSLQAIMHTVQSKIKGKQSDGIAAKWNEYIGYSEAIDSNFEHLNVIGLHCLPEVEINNWKSYWDQLHAIHHRIKSEAEACELQLKMIETYTPNELDELTQTILKHIPVNYSETEAHKYTDEYMQAFEAIKQEATQKKNLWDKFLDILAGGIQQTPAQRVMMQRWVNGEKGELH